MDKVILAVSIIVIVLTIAGIVVVGIALGDALTHPEAIGSWFGKIVSGAKEAASK